jgi:hypothetical protein
MLVDVVVAPDDDRPLGRASRPGRDRALEPCPLELAIGHGRDRDDDCDGEEKGGHLSSLRIRVAGATPWAVDRIARRAGPSYHGACESISRTSGKSAAIYTARRE